MENSPLAKLPAELRNNIWELALRADKPVEVTGDYYIEAPPVDFKLAPNQVQEMAKALALTQTCRQIHSECILLFFHVNTFEFDSTMFPSSIFPDLRRKIGNASLSAISSVIITIRTRFSGASKWSLQLCNKTCQAVDCLKALPQPANHIRIELESSTPIICPSMVISLQEWNTSWKAAEETIEEAVRTTRDPRRKNSLIGVWVQLLRRKRDLKELLGIPDT